MPEEQPPSVYEKHRRKGRRMADFALQLPVAAVRNALSVGQTGRVSWTTLAGLVGGVAYAVVGPADPLPAVVLRYVLPDGRRVETTVRLTATRTRHGGRRAWFLCPGVSGVTCGRRVGTLYQPPGEPHFACRVPPADVLHQPAGAPGRATAATDGGPRRARLPGRRDRLAPGGGGAEGRSGPGKATAAGQKGLDPTGRLGTYDDGSPWFSGTLVGGVGSPPAVWKV